MIVVDGEVKEKFDFKVQPNPKAEILQEALDVAGVTKEQIMAYPPMGEIYKQFVDLLSKYVDRYNKKDKFFLAGYNIASFDNSFLRAWFIQNGDKYFGSWFWSNCFDVMVLATPYLSEKRAEMENFKQGQWRKHSVSMWMIQSYMMLYMILRFVSRYVILFYLVELILFDYGEEKDKRVYSYTR